MRAILHIGTEKTGSSSIQSLLRKNRSALRRQGYQTSRELGRPSQIALAVAALPTDVRWRVHRRLSLDTDEDVRAYRVDRRSALEKELAGVTAHSCSAASSCRSSPTSRASCD